jgi:hypothetical protein
VRHGGGGLLKIQRWLDSGKAGNAASTSALKATVPSVGYPRHQIAIENCTCGKIEMEKLELRCVCHGAANGVTCFS